MRLSTEKIKKNGINYTLKLEIPKFYNENTDIEEINLFYMKIVDVLEKSASLGGYTIVSELKKAYCSDEIVSIYIDIYWYKNGELINCKRISDTRDSEGFELHPPKQIKNKISKNGGWFYSGTDMVVYKNDFTAGDEKQLRRSSYYKLFKEQRFDVNFNKQ